MRPRTPPVPGRCVETVVSTTGWHHSQCQRKNGYGPNGDYCKQHAPSSKDDAKPWFKVEPYSNTIKMEMMVEVSDTLLSPAGSKARTKKTGYYEWFPTMEEARVYLLGRLTNRVKSLREQLERAEDDLRKFNDQEKQ